MDSPTVWDALIAWRDNLLKKDILRKSKVDYLSNMTKLIEIELLDLEQPLSEFIKNRPEERLKKIDKISAWSDSTKQSRRTLFRSFYRFSQQKKIKKTDIAIPFNEHRSLEMLAISELLSSNEDKAKSQHLTPNDINRFLIRMRDLNFRDYLICRLMWELKCTIHQILNLSINDIDFSKGIFVIKNEIRFGNIRKDLLEIFQKQCEGKTDLIFSTDRNKKIHPGQIVRTMKTASKLAKLPIIMSPKIIYAHAKAHYERSLASMSEVDRKKMFEELAIQQYWCLKN